MQQSYSFASLRKLMGSFTGLISIGGILFIFGLALTNSVCSVTAAPKTSEQTRYCWTTDEGSERGISPTTSQDKELLKGIDVPQLKFGTSNMTEHCSISEAGVQHSYSGISLCDAKITDWLIVFFTYCLVVLGFVQIKSSERTVRAVERPWLFIQEAKISALLNPQPGVPPRFHLFLQNAGRSQARIVKFRGNLAATVGEIDPEKIPLNPAPMDPAYSLIIPPQSEEKQTAIALQPVPPAMGQEIAAGQRHLYMRGILTYSGPFGGDTYDTAFCVRFNKVTSGFDGYGGDKYNYSV